MAAVFCASLRRRAMVWRSRVICTRSSRAASSAGDGARTCTGGGRLVAPASGRDGGLLDRVEHVVLVHVAVLAGARHGRRHRCCFRPAACAPTAPSGASAGAAALAFGAAACGACAAGFVVSGRRVRPPVGLRLASLAWRRGLPAPAAICAEQRADGDRLAFLGDDLVEHAGGRRRHFDRHLVGFELDQRLVDGDGVADLLEPLADGRFGDGFAEGRNADFGHGHLAFVWSLSAKLSKNSSHDFMSANASSRKASSCARCFDIKPGRRRGRGRAAGIARTRCAWRRSARAPIRDRARRRTRRPCSWALPGTRPSRLAGSGRARGSAPWPGTDRAARRAAGRRRRCRASRAPREVVIDLARAQHDAADLVVVRPA